MKIEKISIPTQSLESFAEEHDLTMVVTERDDPSPGARWYAKFKDAEVKHGENGLAGIFGNGAYADQAIDDYRIKISDKILIIADFCENRREIQVPRLIAYVNDEVEDKDTGCFHKGDGNWYARVGMAREFLMVDDEKTRVHARK